MVLPSPRKKGLLALVIAGLLVGAYLLGAVVHGSSSERTGDGARGPKASPAIGAGMQQRWVPVVAAPAPAPKDLVGCQVAYGSVSVNVQGRVTDVDSERLQVRCPGRPQAHLSLALGTLAANALSGWRFVPVSFGGHPVATTTPLTVTFGPPGR